MINFFRGQSVYRKRQIGPVDQFGEWASLPRWRLKQKL